MKSVEEELKENTEAAQGTGPLDYVAYDDEGKHYQEGFKKMFSNMIVVLGSHPKSRAQSLAITKLEESYMWVGKMVRDDQIKRNGSAPLQEGRANV